MITGPLLDSATSKGPPDRTLPATLMTAAMLAMLVVLPGPSARADDGQGQTTVGLIVLGTPALAATKRGTVVGAGKDGRIDAGARVRWTITVTNTGNTVVSAVTVDDPKAGPVRCPATLLLPGQSLTCTVDDHTITSAEVAAGVVTNVANASAAAQGGRVVAQPAFARVPLPTGKPFIVFPPPLWLPGFPDGLPGHPDVEGPDSDGPETGGTVVGGTATGGTATGGSATGGSATGGSVAGGSVAGGSGPAGPGSGPGGSPGNGSGAGPGWAEPGSSDGHGGASPAPGGHRDARPPVAVAGGQPDEPGRGGLELVVLGTVTAGCALAALGALGARRTRRRR